MLLPVETMTLGTETFTIASGSVTQVAGTTVQGISLSVGDRLLITNAPASTGTGTSFGHSTQPGNGIYTVTSNTTNLSVSRATDLSGSVAPAGVKVFTKRGPSWLGAAEFTVSSPTTSAAFTYGTTSMQWAPSGGLAPTFNGLITAGSGVASNANVYPMSSASYDLGNTGAYWRKIFVNATVPALSTTTTAAGTTTLTTTSNQIQVFTGSTTQTVTLPTTSVVAGQQWTVINTSSGAVTVNSSGGNLVKTVAAGTKSDVTALVNTPTTAAHWFGS